MQRKAQSSGEYILFTALVVAIVAALLIQSFRNTEITLALSSSRLACNEFASMNSSLYCQQVYYAVYAGNVTIQPALSSGFTSQNKTALKTLMLERIRDVFRPGAAVSGDCFGASYFPYCISMP